MWCPIFARARIDTPGETMGRNQMLETIDSQKVSLRGTEPNAHVLREIWDADFKLPKVDIDPRATMNAAWEPLTTSTDLVGLHKKLMEPHSASFASNHTGMWIGSMVGEFAGM